MRKEKIIKITIFTAVVFALGFFAFSSQAQAATNYYVSPTGTGTACSYAVPCGAKYGTYTKVLVGGDTLYFNDGLYDDNITGGQYDINFAFFINSGGNAPGNRVTYQSLNKWGAVIKCNQDSKAYGLGFGMNANKSYINIKDFEIYNCKVGVSANHNNDYITVSGNKIHDVWQGFSAGNSCDYIVSDSNIVYNFGGGNPPDNQWHGLYLGGASPVFSNNLIYNRMLGTGFYIHTGGYAPGISPSGVLTIVNNTMYGPSQANMIRPYSQAISGYSSAIFANNIAYSTSGGEHMLGIGSGIMPATWSVINNLQYGFSTSLPCSDQDTLHCAAATISGTITTNPLFTVNGSDFTLQSGSPAINNGSDAHTPALDILGTARPFGPRGDIGAFEYVSGPATYYIDDSGDRSNSYDGSINKPWATFAWAQNDSNPNKLKPGDTLLLKDGTYTESLNVMVSGTQGNPITIKAENDGKAVIDGQNLRKTLLIIGQKYVDVSGLYVKNSGNGQYQQGNGRDEHLVIIDSSNNINMRRVSVNGSKYSGQMAFLVDNSSYILVEDSASYGYGRNVFEATANSDHVTFRRDYCKWIKAPSQKNTSISSAGDCFVLYGAQYSIVENSIADVTSGDTRDEDGRFMLPEGISIWRADWTTNDITSYNKIIGNIALNTVGWGIGGASSKYLIQGNEIKNNICIDCANGLDGRAGKNSVYDQNTVVDTPLGRATQMAFHIGPVPSSSPPKASDYSNSNTTLKNTNIINIPLGIGLTPDQYITSFSNNYNNLYNVTDKYFNSAIPGANDTFINPNNDVVKYGNGAYLMIPPTLKGQGASGVDIGAEVLYQYENGTLTSNPLWPWPMEDRICAETGYSVTYENGYAGCTNGGGLWKTLDKVYDNPADVNGDDKVNIKDIQVCIKVITKSDLTYQNQCSVLATPDATTSIKDIQVIIRKIINPN